MQFGPGHGSEADRCAGVARDTWFVEQDAKHQAGLRLRTAWTVSPVRMAQNAAPTPTIVMPDAATRNVTTAASRVSVRSTVAFSAPARVPSRARPATVSITPTGATATSAAIAVEARPSRRYATPAHCAVRQRCCGSGPPSGPAASAALMAARLTECPPAMAATDVPTPVVTIDARQGTSKSYERMIATPGTFCEAIVTTYSGIAMPTMAAHVRCGVVSSTRASSSELAMDSPRRTRSTPITTAATTNATATAQRAK